jgi:hypothetical protein
MTRNLYLGADLAPAILAADIPALLAADATIFQHVIATDFPARAKVLADEIAHVEPDLPNASTTSSPVRRSTWSRPASRVPTPATERPPGCGRPTTRVSLRSFAEGRRYDTLAIV